MAIPLIVGRHIIGKMIEQWNLRILNVPSQLKEPIAFSFVNGGIGLDAVP